MTPLSRHPSTKVRALISDVDGTLVTDDKALTAATRAAVAALRAKGIAFCIISSRPPRGLRMLVEPLGLTTPMGGFNGAVIATPDLSVVAQDLLAPHTARRVVELLEGKGVQIWIFAGQNWLVRDPHAPYVGREERTVQFGPTVVGSFEPALDTAAKIVGVSEDPDLLAQCELHLQAALGGEATVVRSQPYYLDITSPDANKGAGFSKLSALLAIPPAEIAVIGDGSNDVAMFARAGLSIAMGNASPEVQRAADFVTESNREDGFAAAVHRFILNSDHLKSRIETTHAGDRP
jgi:Cof subfamily protein (haloacid dehalogenase superfamily)